MRKIKNKKRRLIGKLMIACALLTGCSAAAAADVKPETASNNRVEINDGEYSINGETTEYEEDIDRVYGGGDEDGIDTAYGNSVEIDGGTIEGVIGGVSESGSAVNNRVEINGGTVENAIGGVTSFSLDEQNTVGDVLNNEVIVNGGEVGYVSGGEIGLSYSDSDMNVSDEYFQQTPVVGSNRVRIGADGKITGGVIGGAAYNGRVVNNSIEIESGLVEGEVIAGLIRNPSGEYRLSGNSISINGSPDLSGAYLIGGMLGGEIAVSSDRVFDNTLNINTSEITAKNIAGFQNVNFNLPSSVSAGSKVLTLTDGVTDLSGMHLTVNAHADSDLDAHQQFSLIVNKNGFNGVGNGLATSAALDGDDVSLGNMTYTGIMTKGASFDYDLALDLSDDGSSFDAFVGAQRVNENVMPPVLSPVQNLINLPTEAEQDALEDTQARDVETIHEQRGFEVFGNVGGGHLKTKTGNGSYVKSNMGTYDLGFARHFKHDSSILTFAPVFEYGHGSYDSRLASGVNGSGNQTYIAGGVIARSFNNSGFYYEGSIRAGKNKTDYASNNFTRGGQETRVSYNVDAPIVTGHVRVGNQFRMGKNHLLDVYGFYIYSRQNASHTELNLGDHYRFSSVNSGRFRTGYRLTSRLSSISQLYTGLAFQYDNNSDSSATCEGIKTVSVGQSGSSGMLELGWLLRPIRNNPWTLDIQTTGWIGIQEGFTAMAKVKKAF